MMMIHRMMLKTHLLLTTHVRSVHSILFRRSLQTTKRRGGCAQIRVPTVGNVVGSLGGAGGANPHLIRIARSGGTVARSWPRR